MPATNKFEVSENGSLAVSGKDRLKRILMQLVFIQCLFLLCYLYASVHPAASLYCDCSLYLHRFPHISNEP